MLPLNRMMRRSKMAVSAEALTRKSYVRPVQHSLPLLALMRSADWVRKCLLFGVDRTYDGHHQTDATDPKADIWLIAR
jgi:hypothetical protein